MYIVHYYINIDYTDCMQIIGIMRIKCYMQKNFRQNRIMLIIKRLYLIFSYICLLYCEFNNNKGSLFACICN